MSLDTTISEQELDRALAEALDIPLPETPPEVGTLSALDGPPPATMPDEDGMVGPCSHCGHRWTPRDLTQPPKVCARCRTLRWDKPLRPSFDYPSDAWKRVAVRRRAHSAVARDSYRRRRLLQLVAQLGEDVALGVMGFRRASANSRMVTKRPEAIATPPTLIPQRATPPASTPIASTPIPLRPLSMPPPPPRNGDHTEMNSPDAAAADIAQRRASLLASLERR